MNEDRAGLRTDPGVARRAGGLALEGKVTIVTGASRGIGAATSKILAVAGATVVLAARDQRTLMSVADAIEVEGGSALVVPTDVNDPASVERMVTRTIEGFGRLDCAFNNAGGSFGRAPIAEVSVDEFDRTMQVNVRGVFLCMKHEIPAMLEAGGGSIVNMSSTVGLLGWPGFGAYAASKHGIIGLTQSGALDYAERGIRINAVAPGSIFTDSVDAVSNEQRAAIAEAVPMHRIGLPREVGATVAWLCSDEATFVTGAVIPVDGGQLARA